MTFFADLLICLRFFTRLPVPATARERQLGSRGLAAAMLMVPLAGLVLALPSVGILWVSSSAGLPFFPAATLSLATAITLTGALHEDALADCADGFGGGRTRERKLAIMRDSTIGTYGATALALSLLLRTSAIAAAASQGRGGTALMVAATLSRAACFAPLAALAPARNEGRGAAVRVCGRPFAVVCVIAAFLAVAVAVATHSGTARALVAVLAAVIATSAFTTIAWRQIGGQTGDVAGGAQQAAEMAVLLVYATGGT